MWVTGLVALAAAIISMLLTSPTSSAAPDTAGTAGRVDGGTSGTGPVHP